jgi:glycosyltransferase involved in cell wall biosynthesis
MPPTQTIGAQRPYKLAKYLPQFGWEPIVLTIKIPGRSVNSIRVIETDYKDIVSSLKSKMGLNAKKGLHEQLGIRTQKNFNHSSWKGKLVKLAREIIAFPDDSIGWYKYALQSASNLFEREKVDAMISTSYPVTSHLIAHRLKTRYKIPWVADFRDLWTQNHYVRKYKLLRLTERWLELKTLSNADFLVTVHPLEDVLQSLHKNKPVLCVTNGYDPDDFPGIPVRRTDKFTITYTGILYAGKRDPAMLFRTVRQLIDDKEINEDIINIRFFGPKEQWLNDEVKKYELEKVVSINDPVPREHALQLQRESQILLILRWDNKDEEKIIPGKLFEYFGAKRPILAIGAGGVVKDMLEATNAGCFAKNETVLRDILLRYYHDFIKFGEVGDYSTKNITNYTYYSIAKQYSDILNDLPY